MSITGLAIIYIIIWWIVFFAILPIDVNRQKSKKVEGEDPGSPENPKMLKKFIYGLEEEIDKTTRSFKLSSRQQEHNLIDALKIACRKYSKEKTGKKPITNINLVRI